VADPKNDEELVRPARDGTLRVLKAARHAGVKRVVSAHGMGQSETPAKWRERIGSESARPCLERCRQTPEAAPGKPSPEAPDLHINNVNAYHARRVTRGQYNLCQQLTL